MTVLVGPVLEAGDVAQGVVAAIFELNPGTEIRNRGSYLRVLVPNRCFLTTEAVERALGRPFHLPGDLELIMPSFAGAMTIEEKSVVWEAGRP